MMLNVTCDKEEWVDFQRAEALTVGHSSHHTQASVEDAVVGHAGSVSCLTPDAYKCLHTTHQENFNITDALNWEINPTI